MCPQYVNEICKTTNQNNTVTKNSSLKLFQPLRIKALSQKCLSYLGPFIWNCLPDDITLSNNVNTFKNKVKKDFLTLLREKIKISIYTIRKLQLLSSHFNHETIIRTGI